MRQHSTPAEPDRPQVAIVQRYVPQYRVPFFEDLRRALESHEINLRLLYGQPSEGERTREDATRVNWGAPISNHAIRVGRRELIWQSCFRKTKQADLVVVEQASRLLVNYALMSRRLFQGRPRVAMWGHGTGFHPEASRLGEALKRLASRRVHWWFAYNEASADSIRALGFPPERITVVQNTLDTSELLELRDSISSREIDEVRASLNMASRNVGIYVGALYREKRTRFLLESLLQIRRLVPDFEAIIIGGGPEATLVSSAAREHPWIHYLGPSFGREKVTMLKLAKVMLVPGRVGLVVIDAFALETPLVTVDGPYHAPEIAYLDSGHNGIILPKDATPAIFAEAVARLLRSPSELERLKEGCREAAARYTLAEMVRRFSDGILRALNGGALP